MLSNVQVAKGRAALATSESSARDEAIAWHLRLDGAGEAEWDEFLAWLEEDPAHRVEFDRAELIGSELKEIEPAIVVADAPGIEAGADETSRRWPLVGGLGAIAASVALVLSFALQSPSTPGLATAETKPGEQRLLPLADGSRIYLNGSTRLLFDRKGQRFARIERGEATFDIRHDAAKPFTVEVGSARLQDIGTLFNVSFEAGQSRVGVSEGAVVFNPARENLTLTRGAVLKFASGKGSAVLGTADPATIGSWRQGQLVYEREPLKSVAIDLSRLLGTEVTVAPGLGAQQFTGVIRVDRDQPHFFSRLGGLLGVNVSRSQAGWVLGSDDRAYRSLAGGTSGNHN